MSMSTHIYAIRVKDSKHDLKVAAWNANNAAGVEQPAALVKYFGVDCHGFLPSEHGLITNLEGSPAVYPYNDESNSGFEVDLSLLAPGVVRLRFVNSW